MKRLNPQTYADDCVHYCLPGVPDVFNGRLLHLVNHKVAPTLWPEPDQMVLARWNPWWYDIEPLVQRSGSNLLPAAAAGGAQTAGGLAMQLRPGMGQQPTRLRCSSMDEVFAGARLPTNMSAAPLLGVCSSTADPG